MAVIFGRERYAWAELYVRRTPASLVSDATELLGMAEREVSGDVMWWLH